MAKLICNVYLWYHYYICCCSFEYHLVAFLTFISFDVLFFFCSRSIFFFFQFYVPIIIVVHNIQIVCIKYIRSIVCACAFCLSVCPFELILCQLVCTSLLLSQKIINRGERFSGKCEVQTAFEIFGIIYSENNNIKANFHQNSWLFWRNMSFLSYYTTVTTCYASHIQLTFHVTWE